MNRCKIHYATVPLSLYTLTIDTPITITPTCITHQCSTLLPSVPLDSSFRCVVGLTEHLLDRIQKLEEKINGTHNPSQRS